jgi:hypothetical protein
MLLPYSSFVLFTYVTEHTYMHTQTMVRTIIMLVANRALRACFLSLLPAVMELPRTQPIIVKLLNEEYHLHIKHQSASGQSV